MSAHGKVTTWYMTPEQLAEYIKKHPIKPQPKRKNDKDFANIHTDYKWRPKKAAAKRLGE
ncbi:hypothetical protein C0966_00645 [Bacillus methanolicus]|uniref:hypothetical protein n=1 Tax=Bacillus methanolicus TaxID=1471 RepID=UPI0023802DB9|nr:hypothetical protein [Bacillus methanolicus]MDE3837916.1 hypothetical protein [Bacillus methanolicus]